MKIITNLKEWSLSKELPCHLLIWTLTERYCRLNFSDWVKKYEFDERKRNWFLVCFLKFFLKIPCRHWLTNHFQVVAVNLRDGKRLLVDMVVVGIGIRPNTSLFEGQLTLEKGGIKVNEKMQSSNSSVYAVGDVAAFPVKLFGETRRLEHVDSARKCARHAVAAIMEPEKSGEFDYVPFFYSRIFALSWQFYGDNVGEVVHFGDFSGNTFGAYWVNKGHLVGSFLEGGTKEEYAAIAMVTGLKPAIEDLAELESRGLSYAMAVSRKPPPPSQITNVGDSGPSLVLEKPVYPWHATAGVILAGSIAAFAYWYGRRRRRWWEESSRVPGLAKHQAWEVWWCTNYVLGIIHNGGKYWMLSNIYSITKKLYIKNKKSP